MRLVVPLTVLLLLLAGSPALATERSAELPPAWDDLLSLSDGTRALPAVRQLDDDFAWRETERERPARDRGEFGGAARRFYAAPEEHSRGVLRERGEFGRFHRERERSAFDSRWAENPRANPYGIARDINRRASPLGSREFNGTDAYVAPHGRKLSARERREYGTGAWTSEEIKRRLAELYGNGCCEQGRD